MTPDTSTTPTDIDPKVVEGFDEFDINVIPTIREVEHPDETSGMDGGLPGFDEDLNSLGDMPETTTLEECESLARMVWNLPGMFIGDHLIRSDEQIKLFAKEMFLYCSKKGIDPRDYVGDWMPLAMIGGSMALGMIKDHKAYKKSKNGARAQSSAPGDGFDTGKGVTGSVTYTDYTLPENKGKPNPASSCGGDATPETMEE